MEYAVDDIKLVHYMQLLEQSIQSNKKLRESLCQCSEGSAVPMKILFHQQLEIDYSKAHLPQLYKEVVESCEMGRNEREVIVESLNQLQFGILFSCIPESDSGEKKLCANISVLHNLKALETIKNYLPQVYSEVSKRISLSRASSFYLLDSLRGFINEQ